MHYFSNKTSKIAWCYKANSSPSAAVNLRRISDLKLRDLAELWIFKLITTKSNLKNQK